MDRYDIVSFFTDFYVENNLSEEELKGATLFLDFLLATKKTNRKDG